MRKFIFLLAAAILSLVAVSCASCTNEDGKTFGIEYALNSQGKTDGSFTLQVVVADFSVNGDANYTFDLSSQNINKLAATKGVQSLDKALLSKDANVAETAKKVNGWLEDAIKVTEFDGHYDIWVKGYVMETFTGLKFEIDKHFTNYPPNDEK